MASWGRALAFGFLVWLVPFAVALAIAPIKGSWRSLFESSMAVTVAATVVASALLYFRRVEQLHDIMVAAGDGNKQVWLLEFGYTSDKVNPNYSWFAIDENTKADYIVKALQYARTNWPWVAQMTVWAFSDPEWTQSNEQYWWAITEPDGTARPAYTAIQQARSTGALP